MNSDRTEKSLGPSDSNSSEGATSSGVRPNVEGSGSTGPVLHPLAVAEATSNWNSFCQWIAIFNFLAALFGLVMLTNDSRETVELGKIILLLGLSAGVSMLIFGYIIQLLFECRNYLREIARK